MNSLQTQKSMGIKAFSGQQRDCEQSRVFPFWHEFNF
jgi:hypothetical protein